MKTLSLSFRDGTSIVDCEKTFFKSWAFPLIATIGLSAGIFSTAGAQAPTLSYVSPINYDGTPITPISNGVSPRAYAPPIILATGFSDPRGIALDALGNIYVADYGSNAIKKVPSGGGPPVTIASLNKPQSVAIDASGNIYAGALNDAGKAIIVKIVAGSGTPTPIYTSTGNRTATSLVFDSAGSLYANAEVLYKFLPGTYTKVMILDAQPRGIAFDNQGNIYELPNTDDLWENPGGTNHPELVTYLLKFITKEKAQIYTTMPIVIGHNIAIDATNNIYISQNSGIQMYPSAGNTTPDLGLGSDIYEGISIDGLGNIFIVDATSKTLKEIKPTGGYYLNKFLPPGLTFNNNTGVIAGDAKATSIAKDYIITAYNNTGSVSANLNLQVGLPAIPSFNYHTPNSYTTNQTIIPLVPMGAGSSNPSYNSKPDTLIKESNWHNGLTQGSNTDALGNSYTIVSNNSITKTTPDGRSTVFANFGDNPITNLVVNAQGNIYVLESNVEDQRVYLLKISPDGKNIVKLFQEHNDINSFAIDASDNIFFSWNDYRFDYRYNMNGEANWEAFYFISGLTMFRPDGTSQLLSDELDAYENVFTDTVGKVYLVSTIANTILRLNPIGGYYLNHQLPTGLSFNSATGVISGTPLQSKQASNYIVTGYNLAGSGSATVNIEVLSNQLSGLSVSSATLSPVFSPGVTSYSAPVSTSSATITATTADAQSILKINGITTTSGCPSASIALNPGNNPISIVVTPQSGGAPQTYTVNIKYVLPPTVKYVSPQSYILNKAISPLAATSTGITAPDGGYSIAPQLPAGLSFNNNTGTISGTPTVLSAPANYTVTGHNIADSVTAIVNLSVIQPDSTGLSGLALSAGMLSPSFAQGTTAYSASVANSVTSVMLVPVSTISGATITVNGAAVGTGSSQAIALNPGGNAITIVVTSPDGTKTKTYNVNVVRASSTPANANLAGVSLSSGTLSPSFSTITANYTASVGFEVNSITLVPTTSAAAAVVTVNGITVNSGAESGNLPLLVGNNLITTRVTSQDGTIKTYKITVTRAASSEAGLSNLSLSSGTMNPAFATGTTSYQVSAGNAVSSLTVTPSATQAGSTITVNGTPETSGTASAAIPLKVGQNAVLVNVTSPDGTSTKSYSLFITRAAPSDATLSSLTISNGTLSPVFAPGTATYSVSVANAVSLFRVTPTASQASAVISVNNSPVTLGSPSAYVPLTVGNNPIQVVVTAPNGTTLQVYTINVTRPVSSNANLSGISVSSGNLSPAFASGTTVYTNSVSATTQSVTVTPTVSEANATVTVNGVAVQPGTASGAVMVTANATTTITLKVTAQDGTTVKTYKVNVVRLPLSHDASLANFTVSNGTLTPVFTPATTSYATTVPNAISLYQVTPTVNYPAATITVNGTAVASGTQSQVIPLIVGDNTISSVVTAEDGVTLRTYTLVVTRQISTNANLANLAIGSGTLSPAFASATTTYTSTVNAAATTITPTTSEANATVTVNGTAVASGTASGNISLVVGINTITVKVTAQNGTTVKTYKINVTRPAPSANADLASLTVITKTFIPTLSPAFDPSVTAYTIDVPTTTTSIKITAAIPSDTGAVVRINGAKGQVSPFLQLNPGANTITISVTAQNGTTVKIYTLTVNRALDTNNYLGYLDLYTGSYSPSFTNTGTSYTQSLPYTITTTTIVVQPLSYAASITINGQSVPFTTATQGGQQVKIYTKSYALAFGANTFSLLVTAESGATRTITVTINRAGPPVTNNANLSNLTVSPGTLSPAFLKTTTNYTATIPYATLAVSVTPTADNQYAYVTVNGTAVAYGHSINVPVTTGTNLITLKVLATDSTTIKTYKLIVTVMPPSTNAGLASLTTSEGSLTPAFATATTSYSITVPNNTGSIAVHATPSDLHSTISPGSNIILNPPVGTSNTNIIVTAQDGVTTKTYTLAVTRAASANANLASLSISQGMLSPSFSPSTANYTASVANFITDLDVMATTAEPNGMISINGGAGAPGTGSATVHLNVGSNVITAKVTAQDGTTIKTYKITATRATGSLGIVNNLSTSYASSESIVPVNDDVTVQQVISPNGDGINDHLVIAGINAHPDNKLMIIDRSGTLVYEALNYDNNSRIFDGRSNKTGKLQLPGVYFYLLNYKTGDETKHKTGYLIIVY